MPEQSPAYEEYLNPEVIWWPWGVAQEYYRRKTLVTIDSHELRQMGRKGRFKYGKRAGAPSRKAPVDAASFMQWVHGGRKGKGNVDRNQIVRIDGNSDADSLAYPRQDGPHALA